MRKSIWTVLFTALVALVAVSCAKETDLTDVKNKIDELDQRVTALEKAVEKINKETVPGFENLVKALNEKLTVVSVIEGADGVTITFSDGTTSVITNGKDGTVWEIGTDGYWYKDGVKTDYYALGTKGDVLYWNPFEYLEIFKGGVETAASIHVAFDTAQMAFRAISYVNGMCKYDQGITLVNSSTQRASYVTLATRS